MARADKVSLLVRSLVISSALSSVSAITPLVDKRFSYPNGMPYQADTDTSGRGPQVGYNQCGPSTEGQSSLCQTSFLNSVDDFCLWAPINPNSVVGDVEGEMVAWCTKPGRGTRVIPAGAIQGVQFTKTPDYVQVVGFIDQTQIDLASDDSGGEMDPHGADQRGNPLGGLVYSTAFTSNKNDFEQVIEWHNFMGSNTFCFKACDPAGPNAAKFCQHIYDRIGCAYNAPSNAKSGVFESCKGDDQDYPGIYTDAQGKVETYTQPPESLGPITSMPYVARVPASSDCVQYASAELFAGSVGTGSGGATVAGTTTTSSSHSTATTSSSGSSIASSGSRSSSAVSVTATSASSIPSVATNGSSTITSAPSPSSTLPESSTATVAPPRTTNAAQSSWRNFPYLTLYLVWGFIASLAW